MNILISGVLALFLLALVSCSEQRKEINSDLIGIDNGTSKNGVTQINWIGQWVGEGDKEVFIRELANEYEFRNQNVKVNLKFKDDVYQDKDELKFIVEQLQKPVADWDIILRIHIHYNQIAEILHDNNWGEKYLVDFGKIPGFIESHKSFINSNAYKNQYGKIYYGSYSEGQLAALFVNTEVAKKIGISVKQFGMTFEDFKGYLKAANEYNKTHPNIIPLFSDNWNKAELIYAYLFYSLMDNYDQVIDTRLTPQKLAAAEKCYEAFEELSKFSPIEKNRSSMLWERTNHYPLEDSCLFYPNFTFMYNIWKLKGKDKINKIVPCEFPVFRPSTVCIGGYVANWAVLKNAPHKDEAIKLMTFWCRPDITEKWVRYTKCSSGVKGNLTETTFGSDVFESYLYTMEKKYNGNMVQDIDKQYILGKRNSTLDLRATEVIEGKLSANAAFRELKMKLVKD